MDYFFLQQKSTFATAREIMKEGGFGDRGLSKGLTSSLFRDGIFNMVYFSFYHNVKDIIPKSEVSWILVYCAGASIRF